MHLSSSDMITLAGVVVSGVSASAAVVSAIWAVASARRARTAEDKANGYQAVAEQQARRATQAAEESATAQRRSADAAEKSVAAQRQSAAEAQRAADALEKQNRMAEEQADLAEGVPWRIEFQTGSIYDLWNDTGTPKFHVHIAGAGVLREKTVPRLDGRSNAEFMGLDAMGVGSQVDVTWYRREDRSDEPGRWTGNKPPKR